MLHGLQNLSNDFKNDYSLSNVYLTLMLGIISKWFVEKEENNFKKLPHTVLLHICNLNKSSTEAGQNTPEGSYRQ